MSLIIAVSGCISQNTANPKVLGDYNLSVSSGSPVIDKYIVLPNGTKSVTIEYSNITPVDIGMGADPTNFQFSTLNVVAQEGQSSTNYAANIVDLKTVSTNSTPISGTVTLKTDGAKSVGIRDSLGKGNVKIIITQ